MLTVEGLSVRFGGVLALFRCQLEVRRGEVHALIGPNGAGKTTLINAVSGLVTPFEGRIFFRGRNIVRLPAYHRFHLGIARTFQISNLFKRFTVRENLELAVQARMGSSFRFWSPVAKDDKVREKALAVAERVGLASRLDSVVNELSHGEQRVLEIAMALGGDPELLLLDEPLAGMGYEESLAVVDFIRTLKGKVTILLVEHDLDAVFQLADRVTVLVYGQIVASGVPDEVRVNPEVQRAYLGEEGD